MADKNGNKTGGRKKGTANKQTVEIRGAYQLLIENNLGNLKKWIEEIAEENPEKAIDVIIKLSEYVVPKLSRTEVKETTSLEVLLKLTPKERQNRIIELKQQIANE